MDLTFSHTSDQSPSTVWYWVIGFQTALIILLTSLGYNIFSNILGVLMAAVVFALLSRRPKQFLNDWLLYLLGLSFFNLLRGTVYSTVELLHIPVHAHYVIVMERFLTGGHILPHVLQSWWHLSQPMYWVNVQFAILYAVHFVIFLVLGFAIWKNRPQSFGKYKAAFIVCVFAMVVCYLVIPSVPPWMASERHLIPSVLPLTELIIKTVAPTVFNAFNGDPIACMPSIHAAFAMLCGLIAIHEYRWKGLWMLIYTVWLDVACIALGAHYFTDILMGNLLALAIYGLVYQAPKLAAFKQQTIAPSKQITLSNYRLAFVSVLLLLNIFVAASNTVTLHLVRAAV